MVQKKLRSEKKVYVCDATIVDSSTNAGNKKLLMHERNANTPTLLNLLFCRILLQRKWHQLLSDPSVLLHHPPAHLEFCLLK